MHPAMAVGIGLAFFGFVLFAGAFFGHGGASTSRQFQVMASWRAGATAPRPGS
jgi:hypothetical protein